MKASLLEKEKALAEMSLVLATKDQFTVDSKGGEIQDSEGKIKLSFPADTFAGQTVVQIGKPSWDEVPVYSLSGQPFSIKAQDNNSKANLHQFDREIEIEVSYSDLNIPEGNEGSLYLYWYNPEIKEWEALPSSINPETKKLKGVTSHFSVFDVGVNNWQASRTPTVDGFQVSEFSGAASYSLPIEVPASPAGLSPNVSLSYSSQVIDQATLDTQASWVGMGWSLATNSIELNTRGMDDWTNDDTYYLNVVGVSCAGYLAHPPVFVR